MKPLDPPALETTLEQGMRQAESMWGDAVESVREFVAPNEVCLRDAQDEAVH